MIFSLLLYLLADDNKLEGNDIGGFACLAFLELVIELSIIGVKICK